MKIVAIKNLATGNSTVGAMWQETKVFDHEDRLIDVMEWVGDQTTKVSLTIPDNYDRPVILLAFKGARDRRNDKA